MLIPMPTARKGSDLGFPVIANAIVKTITKKIPESQIAK